MSTTPNNPGQYVQDCRIRAKLTQTQVAVALGITEQAVSSWERNAVPLPKQRIMDLYRLLRLDRTKLLDLMAARYRAELVEIVKQGART